jgi:ElaA protein
MIRWQWCELSELSAAEVYAVLAARSRVFVVEQQCAFQDADELDLGAEHLVAWAGPDVAAYLRVLAPGVKYTERSIGRVITALPYRRTGLGRELMARALAALDQRFARERTRIGAQARLELFYASFGYARASEPYIEDGIPHIEMLR